MKSTEAVEVPPTGNNPGEDMSGMTFRLERKGRAKLSAGVEIGDLHIEAGSEIDLNGHIRAIHSVAHALEGTVAENNGSIVWMAESRGTLLLIRQAR